MCASVFTSPAYRTVILAEHLLGTEVRQSILICVTQPAVCLLPAYALVSHSETADGPPEPRRLRRLLASMPVPSRRIATFCTVSQSRQYNVGHDVIEGNGSSP